MQKTNQKEFRIEKVIKWKGDKLSNGKDMTIRLIFGLIKKRPCIKMSQYFPKPFRMEEILTLKLISQIMHQKQI